MKALDEEVFETLKSRVSENLTPVRRAAVKCLTTFLTKFQGRLQEVVPLLKQRLEVEDDSYIVISSKLS
jgi:UV DNA damage repair endonuclease